MPPPLRQRVPWEVDAIEPKTKPWVELQLLQQLWPFRLLLSWPFHLLHPFWLSRLPLSWWPWPFQRHQQQLPFWPFRRQPFSHPARRVQQQP